MQTKKPGVVTPGFFRYLFAKRYIRTHCSQICKWVRISLRLVKQFEKELLEIESVVSEMLGEGVDFDLSGWWSNIRYVIIVPKYAIQANGDGYFQKRRKLIDGVILLAAKHGLWRTEDRIEDYGAHFYFVFRCDDSWPDCKEAAQ